MYIIHIQKVGDEVTRIDGRAVQHAITTNNDGRASISILSQMLQGAEGSYVTLLISRHGEPPQEPLVCCSLCCSVLQCVAVCCSVLQRVAVCRKRCSVSWIVLQCVAVCRNCCRVLHSVLQENKQVFAAVLRFSKCVCRNCCSVLRIGLQSVAECVASKRTGRRCGVQVQQTCQLPTHFKTEMYIHIYM